MIVFTFVLDQAQDGLELQWCPSSDLLTTSGKADTLSLVQATQLRGEARPKDLSEWTGRLKAPYPICSEAPTAFVSSMFGSAASTLGPVGDITPFTYVYGADKNHRPAREFEHTTGHELLKDLHFSRRLVNAMIC